MKNENKVAFKEWAVVVDALARGKQILILRKGGIREDGGEFQVEYDEFFLFPTYEHQNKADIKPEAHGDLEFAIETKPTSNLLPIEYYVRAENVIQITDETELERLKPYHVWSDEAVKKRFHYGRQKGLFIIASRIFRLPSPHVIKVTPEYAGCKSWVGLNENLSTHGAKPVLSEAAFQSQWALISSSFVKS